MLSHVKSKNETKQKQQAHRENRLGVPEAGDLVGG